MSPPFASWRTRAGLTQGALAALVGVDVSTITHIERGRRDPSVAVLANICSVLPVSPEEVAEAVGTFAHRRTTTAATGGTDSRNGPTVLEGLASTSIGVSSAAQDVSGRTEERVSNMVTSGDPLNVAPPHRHTQPSERDE